MKSVVVALIMVQIVQVSSDDGKERVVGEEGVCGLQCVSKCKSNLKNYECQQKCCEYGKAESHEKEKVKWWVNTQASKSKNFSTCQNDCDKFCYSIKGDSEVCKAKCSQKFCAEGFRLFEFVVVGIIVGVLVIVVVKKCLGKRNQVNEEFGYGRFE